MFVIGILGGVASGKSLVSEQLRLLGAETLDADRIGHEVLGDTEVQNAIRKRWGYGVFDAHGEVVRPALAKIVFAPPPAGPQELIELEKITHPKISHRIQSRIDQLTREGQVTAVVLDAPVLLKAGWNRFCDQILFVEATDEQRLARARTRGWSAADFAAREAAQESLAEKRRHADQIIDNSGTPAQTLTQIQQFWKTLIH